MTGYTNNYSLPYPEGNNPVVVHSDMERLAQRADTAIGSIATDITDQVDAAKNDAITAAAADATTKANTARTAAIQDATQKYGGLPNEVAAIKNREIPIRGHASGISYPDGIDSIIVPGVYHAASGGAASQLGLPNVVETFIRVYQHSATVVQEIDQVYSSGIVTQSRARRGTNPPTWTVWRQKAHTRDLELALQEAKKYTDDALSNVGTSGASIVLWGSSSSAGIAPELAQTLQRYGWGVIPRGNGGEWSGQTMTRIGAPASQVTFPNDQIPASGSVEVESPSFDGDGENLLQPLTGNVAGVHGKLVGSGRRSTGNVYTFTRTTSDEPVDLTGPVAFEPDHNLWENPWLIWAGKNDVNVRPSQENADNVIARVDAAFDANRSEGKKVLVLGHFINYGTAQDSPSRTYLNMVNDDHAQKYGLRYIDVPGLLRSPDIWDATGINPTQTDLDAQTDNVLAPSLTGVGNHLNTAAEEYISQFIVDRMGYLGWI